MSSDTVIPSERSQTQSTNTAWFHVYEVHRTVKYLDAENRIVVTRG